MRGFEKIPMPQFKHQQPPNASRVIAAFREVFVKHAAHGWRVEIAAL
jgi:hypothetical protein